MHNLELIEAFYREMNKNLSHWFPEGIIPIDLELLHSYDLLHFQPTGKESSENLTQYFHVMESDEKITLINDEFVIWIVPDLSKQGGATYAFIALNQTDQDPLPQTAFSAIGVYNTSHLVLKVLEKYLIEIQETEKLIHRYEDEV